MGSGYIRYRAVQNGFRCIRGHYETELRIIVVAALCGSGFGVICLLLGLPLPVLACFKLFEAIVAFYLIGHSLRWRLASTPDTIWRWVKEWRHGIAFGGIAVCALLFNKLNIYLLDYFSGSYALGLYAASWEIVDGLCIIISSTLLGKVMFPYLAGQLRQEKSSFLRTGQVAAQWLLLCGLTLSFALYSVGGQILPLIFGENYTASTAILYAQIPCILSAFLYNLWFYILVCMNRYATLFVVYATALISNVILCFALIPTHGPVGAALAISGTKVFIAITLCTITLLSGLHKPSAKWLAAFATVGASFVIHALLSSFLPNVLAAFIGLLPLGFLGYRWFRQEAGFGGKDLQTNPCRAFYT